MFHDCTSKQVLGKNIAGNALVVDHCLVFEDLCMSTSDTQLRPEKTTTANVNRAVYILLSLHAKDCWQGFRL